MEARRLLTDLAAGEPDALITREAMAALKHLEREVAQGGPGLERLWEELGKEDSRTAFRAMRELARDPEKSVPFLRERLKAGAVATPFADEPKRIARLIIELDHDDFGVREAASVSLKKLGKLAEASLLKALKAKPSAESQRRLTDLIDTIAEQGPLPERLRAEQALEVLEWVGNDQAVAALEALVRLSGNEPFRQEIRLALRRLHREL